MDKNFSLKDYCKDPDKYRDKLKASEISYYNCECAKGIKKEAAGACSAIGDKTEASICNLIESFFSLENVAIIYGIKGAAAARNLAIKAVERTMARAASGELTEAVTLVMAKNSGVSEFAASAGTIIRSLIIDTGEELGVSFAAMGGLLIGSFSAILTYVLGPVMLVQMVGTVVDAVDPCNLNSQVDFSSVSGQMNQAFMKAMTAPRCGGRKTSFPAYAKANSFVETPKELLDKADDYFYLYLSSLDYNSLGQPINHSLNILKDKEAVVDSMALWLAANNTVAANWIKDYLPLVILVVGALVVILLSVIYPPDIND